ncbi:MAG: hypothetical protein ABI868_01895 [Acidobacteriota bacterium]
MTFAAGQTTCDPASVDIGAGDTVQWTCPDGDLALDFDDDTPFTSTRVWQAVRGQLTPVAVVKPDTRSGAIFRPKISVGNKVAAESLGDLIAV